MNWRTDFDWTDLNDEPVSWSEWEQEKRLKNGKKKVDTSDNLCYIKSINNEEGKMTQMNVKFINSGYGTDDGFKKVNVVGQEICDFTTMPLLIIENPWWSGDTLKCQWYNNEWVCDLD